MREHHVEAVPADDLAEGGPQPDQARLVDVAAPVGVRLVRRDDGFGQGDRSGVEVAHRSPASLLGIDPWLT